MDVRNCTISNNSAIMWWEPGTEVGGVYCADVAGLTNCIVWGNNPKDMGGGCSVTYSCIGEAIVGVGNILADPCFVSGPEGDYYLSQVAAGQPVDSPCVDAGSDTAVNLGLDSFATRSDQVEDQGIVDMGYHYPAAISYFSCWDANECAGQIVGDATCDGSVNLSDLLALKFAFSKSAPWVPPECCADFNHDDSVNLGDLLVLKAGFDTSGYSPSTGNQDCPP
jgi:hypothetical protein